jgi:hypothetical protein
MITKATLTGLESGRIVGTDNQIVGSFQAKPSPAGYTVTFYTKDGSYKAESMLPSYYSKLYVGPTYSSQCSSLFKAYFINNKFYIFTCNIDMREHC